MRTTADRVGGRALYARQRLLEIVLDILGEIEGGSRHLVGKFLVQLFDELVLRHAGRLLVERLEWREQLDVGERGRVAAVVRPAVLGNHREDFRVAQHDLAQFGGRRGTRYQSGRRRQLDPNPQISFLQMRQELASELGADKSHRDKECHADQGHRLAMDERPA
jgi:hypothetical protein